jgi:CheY-like chemotaxis protein
MAPGKKILVVDDEKSFLDVIREALEIRGFEVLATTNAVEAGLALADKKPDLILMDIKMPGINGLQACEAIRRNVSTKNLPIVVISALSDESDIKKAYKAGISDYLVKPVDIEKLVKRIKEILNV